MRLSIRILLATAAFVGSAAGALAQGPGPGGPGGGRPMNLLIRAIDANSDGEISADEIEKAATALKTLDKNNDGKLTDEELRPAPPPGGGGGPGQRGAGGPGFPGGERGGPGGPGGPGETGGPAPSVEEIVVRYQSLDVNKDGKITKDEIPERMQGFLTRADTDNDEVVTKEELTRMAERQAASGNRGGPGGGGPRGGGPRGEGAPGGGGPNVGPRGGGAPGPGGPAGGSRGGGGPGGFGPPNPQAFVERALEFDADKDGKLSKEELTRMAEQMGPGRAVPGERGAGGPQPQPIRRVSIDNEKELLASAGNGEPILHPLSRQTYDVMDQGLTVHVPQMMVYVPKGPCTIGSGPQANSVTLDGYCIGKFHVTNAEYKTFLDATGDRAPPYWKNGKFPEGKANHPVAFVSMTQAKGYVKWLSDQTGWKYALPNSEQWEKAARGPNNTLYPWGDRLEANYVDGVLTSKCNFNAVLAAEYLKNHPHLTTAYSAKSAKFGGQQTTVEKIAAYDDAGRATPLSIGSGGQVRGWVAHSTNTGFIGTDLFRAISDAGGNTTPVGHYQSGVSGYGCYDMAGNVWNWCDTQIIATNGAERGKTVNEIRGGSWYATGASCKSVSIGEGRAPSGAYNTVGFRIAMIPSH